MLLPCTSPLEKSKYIPGRYEPHPAVAALLNANPERLAETLATISDRDDLGHPVRRPIDPKLPVHQLHQKDMATMQDAKIVQDASYGFDLYDYASAMEHIPLTTIDNSAYATTGRTWHKDSAVTNPMIRAAARGYAAKTEDFLLKLPETKLANDSNEDMRAKQEIIKTALTQALINGQVESAKVIIQAVANARSGLYDIYPINPTITLFDSVLQPNSGTYRSWLSTQIRKHGDKLRASTDPQEPLYNYDPKPAILKVFGDKQFFHGSLKLDKFYLQDLINDLLQAGIYGLANDLVKIHSQGHSNVNLVGTNLSTSPASVNPEEQAAKLELARFAISEINKPGQQIDHAVNQMAKLINGLAINDPMIFKQVVLDSETPIKNLDYQTLYTDAINRGDNNLALTLVQRGQAQIKLASKIIDKAADGWSQLMDIALETDTLDAHELNTALLAATNRVGQFPMALKILSKLDSSNIYQSSINKALSLVLTSNGANNKLLAGLIGLGAIPVYGFSDRTNKEAVQNGLAKYPAAIEAYKARGTENPITLVRASD